MWYGVTLNPILSMFVLQWILSCLVVWCSTVLYCTALYCTVLHYTALHCIALHYTALHCNALISVALFWTRHGTKASAVGLLESKPLFIQGVNSRRIAIFRLSIITQTNTYQAVWESYLNQYSTDVLHRRTVNACYITGLPPVGDGS